MSRLVETTRNKLFHTAATYLRGVGAGMTCIRMNPLPVGKYTRPPKGDVMSEPIAIGSKKSDSAMGRPVATSCRDPG